MISLICHVLKTKEEEKNRSNPLILFLFLLLQLLCHRFGAPFIANREKKKIKQIFSAKAECAFKFEASEVNFTYINVQRGITISSQLFRHTTTIKIYKTKA